MTAVTSTGHAVELTRDRRCLCRGCGEVFSSVGAFDQHQRPAGSCLPPASRGLTQDDRGVWVKHAGFEWPDDD